MNMIQMMQQAQKMQKKLKETQDALENELITVASAQNAVEVVCNGKGQIKSLKLKPEAINPENPQSVDTDTLEMLEDLLTETLKNAQAQAHSQMESKLKAVTGGINIPGLF